MQWTDEGIVIGVKRHGEASAILELMTRAHGRHLGLVRGGFGSRMKPMLQIGNGVSASWRARLDEHLGNYTIEPMRPARVELLRGPARDLRRQPSGRADAAAARARSACRPLFGVRRGARPARRSGAGGAVGGAVRIAAFDRTRLRPRSRAMRLDRHAGRSDLCLAEIGAGGLARGRRALGRQDAAAAGLPARPRRAAGRPRSRRRLCADRHFSWHATCWSRAGLRSPTSARISSRRCCVARAARWRSEDDFYASAESGRSSGKGPNAS